MFKKRSTKLSKSITSIEDNTAGSRGEKNNKTLSWDSSDSQNNEEDEWDSDEESIDATKTKSNKKMGFASRDDSSEIRKNGKMIKPKSFLEEENSVIEENSSIKEKKRNENEEPVFQIKRNKPRKREKNSDLSSKKLSFFDDTNIDKKCDEEEGVAGEGSYEKKYSIGNLAKLIKKQQKKAPQRQEPIDINDNMLTASDRNTAGQILEMDENNNNKKIQVFDDKQIEEIKRKKILLRAKLQSKREREFVSSAGIENEPVPERFVTGSSERPVNTADEDKINLDMGLLDSDSSEDESDVQPAIETDEASRKPNDEEVANDNEDDETKKKRMEIEDKLYEYELDNGILDIEHEDKEQLYKWELEKMYHGIKQDENLEHPDTDISGYAGDSKYNRNTGTEGQELKELLYKKDKMKKYTEFPKICKSVEDYRSMKNNNTDMMIALFNDLKLCKQKQVLDLNGMKLKTRQLDTRIEELKSEIWEIKQQLATL